MKRQTGFQTETNKPYRPDLEPGFWANYKEPTDLAKAIQYPLADPNWHNRVINAYLKKDKSK